MIIFKLYFQILKKHIWGILFYGILFLGYVFFLFLSTKESESTLFQEKKIQISFVNEDSESALITGFQQYLSENCEFVVMNNDETAMHDAYFYGKMLYSIRVPEGFAQSFMKGSPIQIDKKSNASASETLTIDLLINRYFQIAELYRANHENLSQQKIVELVKRDMDRGTEVSLYTNEQEKAHNFLLQYCSYMSCALIAILTFGIGLNRISFNLMDMTGRYMVAPMRDINIKIQLFLGDIIFTAICLISFLGIGISLIPNFIMDPIYGVLILNSMVFSSSILALSFLVGATVKSRSMASVISLILALVLSFFGGVFLPQDRMNNSIQTIAEFTPSYWYIKANELVGGGINLDSNKLEEILYCFLIQIGFAITLFAIVFVIDKMKKQTNIRKTSC